MSSELPPFAERISHYLLDSFCSREARRRASPDLGYGRHNGPATTGARNAAVMIALFRRDNVWHTTLTVRNPRMNVHAGQVCFPGGAQDAGESLRRCAERECDEELGPHQGRRIFMGELEPIFVFASNHRMVPMVYYYDPPCYQPQPAEVAQVLETKLDLFLGETALQRHWIHRWGTQFSAPHYTVDGNKVWGATAVVLSELTELFRLASDS